MDGEAAGPARSDLPPLERAPKRALILANPCARHGEQSLGPAIDLFHEASIATFELPQASTLSLADAIRAHKSEIDFVVIAGGDGTLNAAAPALHETCLPFGILPMGTANDFARTLAIPNDLAAAAKVIIDGHQRAIDLGEVNGCFFFNVASVGFSAAVARQITTTAKKRWGTLGYCFAALSLLRQSAPFAVEIEHDGAIEIAKTVQVSIGNGRFYGGGMIIDETAALDDGRLDVCSLEIDHWWELIALVPALRRGTQKRWRKVRAFPATSLKITTRRPRDINADGEIVGRTPATFAVRPGVLKVFAPPAFRQDAGGTMP